METLTKLELTTDERTELYDVLSFVLEGLDEDDERTETLTSIQNKL